MDPRNNFNQVKQRLLSPGLSLVCNLKLSKSFQIVVLIMESFQIVASILKSFQIDALIMESFQIDALIMESFQIDALIMGSFQIDALLMLSFQIDALIMESQKSLLDSQSSYMQSLIKTERLLVLSGKTILKIPKEIPIKILD